MPVLCCLTANPNDLNRGPTDSVTDDVNAPVSETVVAVANGQAEAGVMDKTKLRKQHNCSRSVVRLVLRNGIEPTYWAKKTSGKSNLLRAVEEGNIERAEMLLQLGVNPNLKNEKDESLLLIAVKRTDESMVNLLQKFGAKTEDNHGSERPVALCYAAKGGHTEIVKSMISAGAAVAPPSASVKPLSLLVSSDDHAMAELLIEAGADVDMRSNGVPPLATAAKHNRIGMITLLLKHGADINGRDHRHWTPLMHAASSGRTDALYQLLRAGADIRACDKNGMTALDCAKQLFYRDAVELLLSAGADPEALKGKSQKDQWVTDWHRKNYPRTNEDPMQLSDIAREKIRGQLWDLDSQNNLLSAGTVERVGHLPLSQELKSKLLHDFVDPNEFRPKKEKNTQSEADSVALRTGTAGFKD